MIRLTKQFLLDDPQYTDPQNARVLILPVAYEGGVSYGKGTGSAPQAVLDASHFLEFYDEVLDIEPYKIGISTCAPPELPKEPVQVCETIFHHISNLLDQNKFVVLVGGDHSITTGYIKAVAQRERQFSVIQFDAHSDLRPQYEDNLYSHAAVMSRVREYTQHTLQLGIRSMCVEEAQRIKKENLDVFTMHQIRRGNFNLHRALKKLPDPVYITFDVDAFDWSVIQSTGTPEPGGFLWDEVINMLQIIFETKTVIGFDLVELSYSPHDNNSPFAVAKLLYKMLGFKFLKELRNVNVFR